MRRNNDETAIFALLHGQIQTPEYLGRYLGVSVLAVFIGFGGYHSWTSFGKNLERYSPQSTKQILALEDWRTGGWQDLPKQRIDLIGEQEEVFAYQWASSISEIDSALTHSGWTEANRFTWFEALKLFSPSIRLEDLAPLPILHDGRLPMATFYRADQSPDQSTDGRLVLRFWQTDYRVTDGSKAEPLLVASVSQEVLEHPVSWFAFMKEEQPSADISRGLLPAENTLNGFSFQMITPNAPALVWKLD